MKQNIDNEITQRNPTPTHKKPSEKRKQCI